MFCKKCVADQHRLTCRIQGLSAADPYIIDHVNNIADPQYPLRFLYSDILMQ